MFLTFASVESILKLCIISLSQVLKKCLYSGNLCVEEQFNRKCFSSSITPHV